MISPPTKDDRPIITPFRTEEDRPMITPPRTKEDQPKIIPLCTKEDWPTRHSSPNLNQDSPWPRCLW